MLLADDAVERVNAHLPDDVRIFGFHRVGRKFSAKDWCHARTYAYVIPTWTCAPRKPAEDAPPFVFDAAARQRLNALLREYKGTHYFHNFTVKMEPKASKSQRYIHDFSVRSAPQMLLLFLLPIRLTLLADGLFPS
jgi:tRNA pseudouridine38-40 synthase